MINTHTQLFVTRPNKKTEWNVEFNISFSNRNKFISVNCEWCVYACNILSLFFSKIASSHVARSIFFSYVSNENSALALSLSSFQCSPPPPPHFSRKIDENDLHKANANCSHIGLNHSIRHARMRQYYKS